MTFALVAAPQADKATKPAAAIGKARMIDINSATPVELSTLPGIGEAYSAMIIAGRPYTRKKDLLDKKIIPASTYESIRGRINVR